MSQNYSMAPRAPTPIFKIINEARERLSKTKHKIMVLSGKGGVGKTFISSMLSLALAEKGYKVALFDADIEIFLRLSISDFREIPRLFKSTEFEPLSCVSSVFKASLRFLNS